jgi:4a-hydroxytetrahydrobiopterin dehydratase
LTDFSDRLRALPGWTLSPDGAAIRREWILADFAAAVELIGRIAEAAERADHHPDLHLTRYRRLAVELSTHDAGGLTDKDFTLASELEAIPKRLRIKD